MTDLVLALLVGFLALSAASGLAIYLYGRFARRPLGPPSRALPAAPSGTPLDDAIAPLVERAGGRSGLMLSAENLQAFSLRVQSARAARRSLDLQYYYWSNDLTGRLLAREILQAADRKVRIRLLVDDINLRGRDAPYVALDSHPHIEVRVFNPSWNRVGAVQRGLELVLRAFSATRRMHNKAWIADGRLALIGGRNIGDEYFDAADDTNFRDMDLLVVGPAVDEAAAVFDRFWNSACVFPIGSFLWGPKGDLAALRARLDAAFLVARTGPYLAQAQEIAAAGTLLSGKAPFHWVEWAEVVSDPPEKSNGQESDRWLHKAIFPLITAARQRLEITSPYFIPGPEGVQRLTELVQAGAEVAVLTNSLAATDVAAVHGAYAHYRAPLLAAGVALYELKRDAQRPHMMLFGSKGASLHTKAFTLDRRTGFVGSFNFDPRSVSLNSEMGVIFESGPLVREMTEIFRQQTSPASSYRVALEGGRLVWHGVPDGHGRRAAEPEAGMWRRFVATLVGLLPIEPQL